MRRWALFALLSIYFFTAAAFAQVQTVGDLSFAVPPGWQYQAAKDGAAMFLKQGDNYWVISVHPPRPTSGNPNADFKAAWQNVVLAVPDYKSVPGYDPYDVPKTVIGYPGKYYDDNGVSGRTHVRLYALETGKSVIPVMVLSGNRQTLDAMDHTVNAVVSSVRQAPLKASPIQNSITVADLAGDWKSGLAFSTTYVDRYTGAYAGSKQTFYGAGYHIAANGSFTYSFAGMINSRVVREEDSGTVELGGEFVTFKGHVRETRYRFLDLQTALDGTTVITLMQPQSTATPGTSDMWSRPAKKSP